MIGVPPMRLLKAIQGALAAVAVVAAATLLSRLTHANTVTAGFVYLLAVLGLAIWKGFVPGTIGSLLATVAFNFFFFTPIGTLRISDPQNWVSLGCFLIATTVASRLVVRERERAAEAESGQREIAALYALCVDLFIASGKPGGLDVATSRALRTIGVQGGGLVLVPEGRGEPELGSWIGDPKDFEAHRLLGHSPPREEAAGSVWRNVHIPVVVGERVAGVLVAYGTRAKRETLESVAKLIALAFERERLLAEQARVEALLASDSFKASLLRAVSHDLTTPLTAILVSLESLRRQVADTPEGSQTIDLIIEETTRLNRRIQNLLAMARLEAGSFVPHREPTPPADLFRSARENLRPIATSRRITAHVAPDCADLDVDPSLTLEILVNLIENADRASPAAAPIELEAGPHPSEPARVRVEVLDRGRGIADPGPRLHGLGATAEPPGAADVPRKGLGLEIARSFAAAQDSSVVLLPREGGGVRARIDMPAALPVGLSGSGSESA